MHSVQPPQDVGKPNLRPGGWGAEPPSDAEAQDQGAAGVALGRDDLPSEKRPLRGAPVRWAPALPLRGAQATLAGGHELPDLDLDLQVEDDLDELRVRNVPALDLAGAQATLDGGCELPELLPHQEFMVSAYGDRAWVNLQRAAAAVGATWKATTCGDKMAVYVPAPEPGCDRGDAGAVEVEVRLRPCPCGQRLCCGVCAAPYVGRETERGVELLLSIADGARAKGHAVEVLAAGWEFTIPSDWSRALAVLPRDERRGADLAFRKAARRSLDKIYGYKVGGLVALHQFHSAHDDRKTDSTPLQPHLHAHCVVPSVAVGADDEVRVTRRWIEPEELDDARVSWAKRIERALRPFIGRRALPPGGCVLNVRYIQPADVKRLRHRLRYVFRPLATDAERYLRDTPSADWSREDLVWWFDRLADLRGTRRWTWWGPESPGLENTRNGAARMCWARTRRVLGIVAPVEPPEDGQESEDQANDAPDWVSSGNWRVASSAGAGLDLVRGADDSLAVPPGTPWRAALRLRVLSWELFDEQPGAPVRLGSLPHLSGAKSAREVPARGGGP